MSIHEPVRQSTSGRPMSWDRSVADGHLLVGIYRRVGRRSRILIGTVEAAGTERKETFSNFDELWEILKRQKRRGKKGKIPSKNEKSTT